MTRPHLTPRLLLCTLLLLISGCKQAIYTDLSESEANDALLTLIRSGISAEKRPTETDRFSVWVSESDMANAIELLKADSQPAQGYKSLGEVFGERSLISSPTEERVRFMYGLQQELGRTLSEIDGVLIARVHIVVPAADAFATAMKPASASVFLKHRPDTNLQTLVPAVKDLVVRSVEGLTAETVSVSLFPARPAPVPTGQMALTQFLGTPVAASGATKLWILFAAPWLIVIALVALLAQATRLRDWFERRAAAGTAEHTDREVQPPLRRVADVNDPGVVRRAG
jgi:type III secretion protein J